MDRQDTFDGIKITTPFCFRFRLTNVLSVISVDIVILKILTSFRKIIKKLKIMMMLIKRNL